MNKAKSKAKATNYRKRQHILFKLYGNADAMINVSRCKGKKAEHLYSALHGTNHFKALRHGSHSF